MPDSEIVYIDPVEWRDCPVKGHDGRDQFGYGKKIVTPHEVLVKGRWRRVYATCFSNAASHWVILDGKKHHILWKE